MTQRERTTEVSHQEEREGRGRGRGRKKRGERRGQTGEIKK